ncbi:Hypothetical_protein [Hexamita inflata]|uniref:Hypothetical_protein n=1 Tax=Hexamita inflata TaxID=28002 RepID=A0AA86R8B9_9EUKA|nr:Hypothetical protein HINF_LOCUS56816 [Hexamita inflata]
MNITLDEYKNSCSNSEDSLLVSLFNDDVQDSVSYHCDFDNLNWRIMRHQRVNQQIRAQSKEIHLLIEKVNSLQLQLNQLCKSIKGVWKTQVEWRSVIQIE